MTYVKGGRTRLVAIKHIPGLFLKKKINHRKRQRVINPDVAMTEDSFKKNVKTELSETFNHENSENEKDQDRHSKTRVKIQASLWTKEWLDKERCQKNLDKIILHRYLILLSRF